MYETFHLKVKRLLSQPSKRDGRLWVIVSLVSYFGFLFLANFFIPYQKVWTRLFRVPTMDPPFNDLRAVLASFECTRLGYDVLYPAPCYPWAKNSIGSLPYPRIWMSFTGLGLNTNHTMILAVFLILIFYIATFIIIGKLNKYEGIMYSLILCSPPSMLLIERANVDIIIYILLFISLMIIQSENSYARILGYISLLIPTFLKLLPLFSFSVILKENRKTCIFWSILLMTICYIYLRSISDDLKVMDQFFEVITWYSFGSQIIIKEMIDRFSLSSLFARKLNLIFHPLSYALVITSLVILAKVLVTSIQKLKQWLFSDQQWSNFKDPMPQSLSLDAFRLGSTLYLGTFIVTVVFDYKLVFFIFTIPQVIQWIKEDHPELAIPSSLALLGIVSTFYLSPLLYPLLIDEIVNWFLWFYFLYAFILTLPPWLKVFVHDLIPRKSLG